MRDRPKATQLGGGSPGIGSQTGLFPRFYPPGSAALPEPAGPATAARPPHLQGAIVPGHRCDLAQLGVTSALG